MNPTAVWLCLICAGSITLISLISSQLYRKEPLINSELMSLVSFAPGFIYGGLAIFQMPLHLSGKMWIALGVKNILYCLSFYFRYESLRKFGPFVGALMLGTQPIIIFIFGLIFLGENLSATQGLSMVLTVSALLLLAGGTTNESEESKISLSAFAKYYIFPTLASGLAIVWDRYFLKGELSGNEFFILDRVVIVPAFLLVVAIIRRNDFKKSIWKDSYLSIFTRNWQLLLSIGLLFTLSVYAYNLALALEKAALVGLFRNAAYPVAAFTGTLLFEQKVSAKKWVSLSLIVLAALCGAS